MALVGTYIAGLVAFLVIDAIWLTLVMRSLFERHVGPLLSDNLIWQAAGGFYALYVAGILYFASVPALRAEAPGLAALNGAILGFLAYGTYEATNMSTLKGWSWSMVIIDTSWGMALTAFTAVVCFYAGRALGVSP